ncbi:sensor histidine kinase [Hymenobacter sp. BT683]|uniref:Sensor histidine kinase n=1 Tax=Hymenobacter jeongseonensis TaxID=2791027 RepID=A0ABS0IJB5_9BACT|nr:sensor histidine kinase [Hymenobacter jeongseonensis]MBF9238469.1 sensor histidine kinase [Hymenobacter jeongseonensis]
MDNTLTSPAAPASIAPALAPASGSWRARAFGHFNWWPRAQETTAVPWWAHALLLFVLLSIDVLLYYATLINPKSSVRIDLVWYVRNGALDALTAALFYWNWAVLFPRTLAHGRMDRYLVAAAASAAVFTLLRMATSNLVYYAMSTNDPDLSTHFGSLFAMLWAGGLVTVAASSGLRITLDYLQSQRQRRELERQHLLTELAMLKTQINPHFLFNTLNNIYSLTSRKSDRAPEAVLRLAESMRYLLYESSADTVPLSQELAHLRSFLDLQRLRLPQAEADAAIVLHTFGSTDLTFPVAPLLLLPLVENAFKHGDLAARPEAIRIELELLGEELHFSVHNYVGAAADLPTQPGGLGLHNLRRRLELLYPGRHALHVRTLPGEYAVELVLQGAANRLTAPRRS